MAGKRVRLLSFDAPVPSDRCRRGDGRGVVCLFLPPPSTWTVGRNALARAIFDAEAAAGEAFRFWLFADDDQVLMRCRNACPHVDGAAACCFDRILGNILGPFHFATYAVSYGGDHLADDQPGGEKAEPDRFLRRDCPDAMFHAIHREAVPILLPYIADLDEHSWWSSQALLFHLSSGCLRGGTYVSYAEMGSPDVNKHSGYPRNDRDEAAEKATLQMHFPGLIPWPLRERADLIAQGDCSEMRHAPWIIMRPSDPAHVRMSASWMDTHEYAACLQATTQRFCAAMTAMPPPATTAA